ncbi:hypothetical protein P9302_03480 [Brevibacillus agri]|uniref:hypothetical protein n=1 Tax=Brevibacillus agri TaxID=51101 RepID=UPI002E21C6B5|nr:hypothetical protein [Brevibacillus agri]
MKKNLFSTIICTVLLTSVLVVPAANAAKVDYSSLSSKELAKKVLSLSDTQAKSQQQSLKSAIANLSDEEFDAFVHNLVMQNNGTDEELSDKLKPLGVELETKKNSKIGTTAFQAADINLEVTSAKRTGQSYYRLIASWDPEDNEFYPATYDLLSIEWDPTVGQYYDYNVGSTKYVTARDGSERKNGIYLFNVHDYQLDFGSYAAVYVSKKKNATLDFGARYVHTYETRTWGTNFEANFSYAKTGPTGGLSFKLTPTKTEKSWQVWKDEALEW